MATYTEFACRASGSNLSAGSLLGDSTEPGTAPAFIYASGNWDGTSVFTVASGNPSTDGVAIGNFVSIFADGSTVTGFVARVTAVSSTTITVSTTAKSGTAPTSGTGTRTLRVGGAWAGPATASGFPLTFLTTSLTNVAGNLPRLNIKNDQIYSITAAITLGSGLVNTIAGYSTTYGDGGRFILDGGTSGVSFVPLTLATTLGIVTLDAAEIRNNGSSGSSVGLNLTAPAARVTRSVFHDLRGSGLSGGIVDLFECEFYNCNQSNTLNTGALALGSSASVQRCVVHDNAGANTIGIRAVMNGTVAIADTIVESNGGVGIQLAGSAGSLRLSGVDLYNNASHGVSVTGSNTLASLENCNFLKNGGWGISNAPVLPIHLRNCGYGTGTLVNTSGTVQAPALADESGAITYGSGASPWVDPANGDFRINLAAARGTGRGTFLQTAPSYAGTVAYPDVGAGQSQSTTTIINTPVPTIGLGSPLIRGLGRFG